ncbi:hypothetical protein CTAYLR_006184 [Chrysophaeum taylorii]|uniref:Uncharacterized protein n=1 Tax=Chrysophaeum taylorii TaxID=2483200 RepID=A0AAD7UMQ1_9STRA|nr:hypothetical protein CTAYLR_006184 [Chrysophaeum taylorii]
MQQQQLLLSRVQSVVFWAVVAKAAWSVYRAILEGTLVKRVAATAVKVVPPAAIKALIDKELASVFKKIHGDGDASAALTVPARGLGGRAVVARLEELRTPYSDKTRGGVYRDPNSEVCETQNRAFELYNCSNALYTFAFPAVRKFEAETIAAAVDMVGGGTAESPSDEGSPRRKPPAINRRKTVAIYASAPTFSHGVVDDIVGLGNLAASLGIGLRVDNCLGGVLLSFGEGAPPFDFEIPGVTSMSVDLHKYGNASKGASVVAFRNARLRRRSYLPSGGGGGDGGGLYVTPTLQGSRNGAIIAQAWATLMHYGQDGYRDVAAEIKAAFAKALEIVRDTEDIDVLGTPDAAAIVPIVAGEGLKKTGITIYQVAAEMEAPRGWSAFTGPNPPVYSICVGQARAKPGVLEAWGNDLRAAISHLKTNTIGTTTTTTTTTATAAIIYGAASAVPEDVLNAVGRSSGPTSTSPLP